MKENRELKQQYEEEEEAQRKIYLASIEEDLEIIWSKRNTLPSDELRKMWDLLLEIKTRENLKNFKTKDLARIYDTLERVRKLADEK